MRQFTNPATALHISLHPLSLYTGGERAADYLARLMSITPQSPMFFTILGVMRSRCDRLLEIANNITEQSEYSEYRGSLIEAVREVRNIFDLERLISPWSEIRANYLTELRMEAIRLSGAWIKNYARIAMISDQERSEILTKINETLDLVKTQGLQGTALFNALEAVAFMLRQFQFIGHDALEREALLLLTTLSFSSSSKNAGSVFEKTISAVRTIAIALLTVYVTEATTIEEVKNAQPIVGYILEQTGGLIEQTVTQGIAYAAPLLLSGPKSDSEDKSKKAKTKKATPLDKTKTQASKSRNLAGKSKPKNSTSQTGQQK